MLSPFVSSDFPTVSFFDIWLCAHARTCTRMHTYTHNVLYNCILLSLLSSINHGSTFVTFHTLLKSFLSFSNLFLPNHCSCGGLFLPVITHKDTVTLGRTPLDNLFHSCTPRYIFSSTFYAESCWCIIQVIHIL
jgi:hypothetical protein